jgi:cytochrome b
MKLVRIWDVPTRVIHWLVATGLLVAFAIAQFAGEHSSSFDYHAIVGLTLGLLIILRLVWGVVGTRHARFTSYVWAPTELVKYARSVVTRGKSLRYAGHNPATSWAALVMYCLLASIILTGVMMGRGVEAAEDLHGGLVYALLAVVGFHVVGVVIHSVRHRENLVMGMLHGSKLGEPSDAISSSRLIVGLLLLTVTAVFLYALIANFDSAQHHTHLPLLGTTINIGEGDEASEANRPHNDHDDHDD